MHISSIYPSLSPHLHTSPRATASSSHPGLSLPIAALLLPFDPPPLPPLLTMNSKIIFSPKAASSSSFFPLPLQLSIPVKLNVSSPLPGLLLPSSFPCSPSSSPSPDGTSRGRTTSSRGTLLSAWISVGLRTWPTELFPCVWLEKKIGKRAPGSPSLPSSCLLETGTGY
jgi:hypothetical protein